MHSYLLECIQGCLCLDDAYALLFSIMDPEIWNIHEDF
jgi:hypothetical protein